MTIDAYLKTVDDPLATVAYRVKPLYVSSNGDRVLGVDPSVQTLVRQGQQLVAPLQIVRRPGLGDKVFALAATRAYLDANPETDVTFAGLDTDQWLKQIPWVKTGLNLDATTVVNLDNTPANGGDRTTLMGRILGVDVTTIEFPINVPKRRLNVKKPYFVFVPFANQNGPRSLPMSTTLEVLKRSPLPLVVTDAHAYNLELGYDVQNCTGLSMLDLLALLAESEGVVACDTGVPWLAAAMGKPALVFFNHIRSRDRTMTCRNVLAVDAPAECAKGCGDHIGTRPACRWKDGLPACSRHLTPEFVRHTMREFGGLL